MPQVLSQLRDRVTSPEAQDGFKRWFDASPIHSGSVLANRMGWQVARTVAKNTMIDLRGSWRQDPPLPAEFTSALDAAGVLVIPDYLAPDQYERVRAAYDDFGSSGHVRDIGPENGSGITFRTGPVISDVPGDDADVLLSAFGGDPLVVALAEHIIRRRVTVPLPLVYQHLALGEGGIDDQDREQMLHADKHYPCAKAIYFVEPVTEASGPFVYCAGSHRGTLERLRFEHAMGVRESMLRAGRVDEFGEFDEIAFARSRNVIGPAFRRRLDLREESLTGAGNTLVVVNNRGFHRRGPLQPGGSRRTLWVNFYADQRPRYGKAAFRMAKRIIDTDNVSRALAPVHQQTL